MTYSVYRNIEIWSIAKGQPGPVFRAVSLCTTTPWERWRCSPQPCLTAHPFYLKQGKWFPTFGIIKGYFDFGLLSPHPVPGCPTDFYMDCPVSLPHCSRLSVSQWPFSERMLNMSPMVHSRTYCSQRLVEEYQYIKKNTITRSHEDKPLFRNHKEKYYLPAK